MGYISNVKSIIAFESVEDRDKFLNDNAEDTKLVVSPQGLEARIVDEPCPAIVIDLVWVKWYGKQIREFIPDAGFDEVIAWEHLMDVAQANNDKGEMATSGVFVRIGEENNDIEEERWYALDGDGEELMKPDVTSDIVVSVLSNWTDKHWEAPSK